MLRERIVPQSEVIRATSSEDSPWEELTREVPTAWSNSSGIFCMHSCGRQPPRAQPLLLRPSRIVPPRVPLSSVSALLHSSSPLTHTNPETIVMPHPRSLPAASSLRFSPPLSSSLISTLPNSHPSQRWARSYATRAPSTTPA